MRGWSKKLARFYGPLHRKWWAVKTLIAWRVNKVWHRLTTAIHFIDKTELMETFQWWLRWSYHNLIYVFSVCCRSRLRQPSLGCCRSLRYMYRTKSSFAGAPCCCNQWRNRIYPSIYGGARHNPTDAVGRPVASTCPASVANTRHAISRRDASNSRNTYIQRSPARSISAFLSTFIFLSVFRHTS